MAKSKKDKKIITKESDAVSSIQPSAQLVDQVSITDRSQSSARVSDKGVTTRISKVSKKNLIIISVIIGVLLFFTGLIMGVIIGGSVSGNDKGDRGSCHSRMQDFGDDVIYNVECLR